VVRYRSFLESLSLSAATINRKRLANTHVRQAGSVLKCPDDRKNRVVNAQATEVQQLVAEFVSSGMRRSEFCQSRGLSFSTLDRHLKAVSV
jgi:hypothetical protein